MRPRRGGRLAQAREQVEAAEADPLPPRLAAEGAGAADDGDDDMYGDLGGGDDDMYGDLGGDDDAGVAMVEEEAIDQNAAELPVVQALGQLEAHSSRRPRRAELAGRAAHRAYLLEALTSGA